MTERLVHFTLKQLKYFIAAGDAGSIRKASEAINVSQPSISTAISQLEAYFNLQLFVRHHAQGLSLTTAGKAVLREAKLFVAHGNELQHLASELSSSLTGTYDFACFNPLAPIIVPEIFHGFAGLYPEVRLNVREGDQAEILEHLKQGTAGLAITYDLHLPDEITFVPLAALPPYVVLPAGHRLAGRDAIKVEELTSEPLVLLDLPLSREYFMSIFMQRGLKPRIAARTEQPEVMRGIVAKGHGYALANVRPRNMAALDGSLLAYVPLEGRNPVLTMGIAMLEGLRRSRVVQTFIDYCCETISTENIPGMTLEGGPATKGDSGGKPVP